MARSMGTLILVLVVCLCKRVSGVRSNGDGQQDIILRREQIFVKVDNDFTFSLMVEPDDTVQDLKQDIYDYEGMTGQRMQLQLGDTRLIRYNKLSFYNVKAGTTFTMLSVGDDLSQQIIKFIVIGRDGRRLPVESQLGQLVASLKDNVAQLTGIAQAQQRLLVRGKELKNELKLIHYDIYNGAQVLLGEPLENYRQATVALFVKTPSGVTFKVELSLAETVNGLKEKIFEMKGVPTGVQTLFANERLITGQDHLCDLELEANSTVFMYLRSSRITSLAEVARLQEPSVTGQPYREAPIFRETEDAGRRPVSIYKDTRNWVRGPRLGWVAGMFDPVAKLAPNPDSDLWIWHHRMILEDYTSPNASEQQRMEAAIVRAQLKLSLTVQPYRVAAKLDSVNKPSLVPGISLGGGFADAGSLEESIPLGADINNWAPDAFSDADVMRLFEVSERVRQLLARSAQTGEGILSIASQRRINYAILLTYDQALAGYAQSVDYSQAKEDETCAICQDDLAAEPATKLPCGHAFHTDCIHTWMAKLYEERHAPSCPFCRQRFMCPYEIQGKTELATEEMRHTDRDE